MTDLEAAGLKEIERRQPKYWSGDGLPQLATGIGWLLWGGVYLIGMSLLEGKPFRAYWAVVTLLVAFWGITVPWALGKLKERMTYPRTGYAQMPLKGRIGAAVYLVGLLTVGVLLLNLVGLRIDLHGFGPFLVCGLIALAIAAPAMRAWSKYDRSSVNLVTAAFWLAIVLKVRDKTPSDAAAYWALVCMGLIGIVFGVLRLRRFLRENPKAAETEL
jgi:hypothetical protein